MAAPVRLQPFLYLVTPLGIAEAHFLWCETFEVPFRWGCFQCETKENWWWANQHVRLCESISAARDGHHSPIHVDQELLITLAPHIMRHKGSPLRGWAEQYASKA